MFISELAANIKEKVRTIEKLENALEKQQDSMFRLIVILLSHLMSRFSVRNRVKLKKGKILFFIRVKILKWIVGNRNDTFMVTICYG